MPAAFFAVDRWGEGRGIFISGHCPRFSVADRPWLEHHLAFVAGSLRAFKNAKTTVRKAINFNVDHVDLGNRLDLVIVIVKIAPGDQAERDCREDYPAHVAPAFCLGLVRVG